MYLPQSSRGTTARSLTGYSTKQTIRSTSDRKSRRRLILGHQSVAPRRRCHYCQPARREQRVYVHYVALLGVIGRQILGHDMICCPELQHLSASASLKSAQSVPVDFEGAESSLVSRALARIIKDASPDTMKQPYSRLWPSWARHMDKVIRAAAHKSPSRAAASSSRPNDSVISGK